MTGITWIASYPKSGNTWIRLFLLNLLLNPDEPASINDIHKIGFGDAARGLYEKIAGRQLGDPPPAVLVDLRFRLQSALARNTSDYVFCKTHWPYRGANGKCYFDSGCAARAIYIVRDPRDVAISFAHHTTSDLDKAIGVLNSTSSVSRGNGSQMRELYGAWRKHVSSWLNCGAFPVHVVRYEDLLADPQTEFAQIVEFIRFPADAERLAKAIRFSRFEEAQAQESRAGFIEGNRTGTPFFREGRSGARDTELSPAQRQALEQPNRAMMRKLRYLA